MNDNHTFEGSIHWPADAAQKLPPDPDFSRDAVLAYDDRATSVLGKDPVSGKMKLLSALLNPKVTVARGTNLDEAKAMHTRAHEYCFVASSVNFPVEVVPEIVEA